MQPGGLQLNRDQKEAVMKIVNEKGELQTTVIRPYDELVPDPNHYDQREDGRITKERLKAALVLGKPLRPGVIIHHYHQTGEMVICESKPYHELLHARQQAYEATGDPHKRRCNICKQYDDLTNMTVVWIRGGKSFHCHHKSCNTKACYLWRKKRVESKRRVEDGEEVI